MFQFSNQVSDIARSMRKEVFKVYDVPSEWQAEGRESTWKRIYETLGRV
jgi:hypothetical protein